MPIVPWVSNQTPEPLNAAHQNPSWRTLLDACQQVEKPAHAPHDRHAGCLRKRDGLHFLQRRTKAQQNHVGTRLRNTAPSTRLVRQVRKPIQGLDHNNIRILLSQCPRRCVGNPIAPAYQGQPDRAISASRRKRGHQLGATDVWPKARVQSTTEPVSAQCPQIAPRHWVLQRHTQGPHLALV